MAIGEGRALRKEGVLSIPMGPLLTSDKHFIEGVGVVRVEGLGCAIYLELSSSLWHSCARYLEQFSDPKWTTQVEKD